MKLILNYFHFWWILCQNVGIVEMTIFSRKLVFALENAWLLILKDGFFIDGMKIRHIRNLYLSYFSTSKKLVRDQIILPYALKMNFAILTIETGIQSGSISSAKTLCKMGWRQKTTHSNSKWKFTKILWNLLWAIFGRRGTSLSYPNWEKWAKM